MNSQTHWYQKRPIPLWIILALYTMQMIGIAVAMTKNRYLDLLSDGSISPLHAVLGFVYPLLTFLGAVFLFLNRKVAIVLFGLHIIWGFIRLLGGVSLGENVSEAIAVGIFIYALRYLLATSKSAAQPGVQADVHEKP